MREIVEIYPTPYMVKRYTEFLRFRYATTDLPYAHQVAHYEHRIQEWINKFPKIYEWRERESYSRVIHT